jgi:hypothetical protein
MKTKDKEQEFEDKLLKGLKKVYEKLIKFKKEKNSVLVIMEGDKIVKIKPK